MEDNIYFSILLTMFRYQTRSKRHRRREDGRSHQSTYNGSSYTRTGDFKWLEQTIHKGTGCISSCKYHISALYKKTFPLEHQGSSNPRRFFSDCLTLEDGTNRLYQNIGTNYQSMLKKVPEEWRSHLHTLCAQLCSVSSYRVRYCEKHTFLSA